MSGRISMPRCHPGDAAHTYGPDGVTGVSTPHHSWQETVAIGGDISEDAAMRKSFLLLLVLFGFGGFGCDDDPPATPPDASIDAPMVTPPLALDCTTYCTHLAADCTGANAQISTANCMGTCMNYTLGTQADYMVNTLGCRNTHLQNIEKGMSAAVHCPHTGPVGSPVADATAVCGASACADFCALDTKVCGTDAAPVTGVTNRYTTSDACMMACANFVKTPEASPTAMMGNTFACRIYHLTNAAAAADAATANTHCGHTLVSNNNQTIVGPCFQ